MYPSPDDPAQISPNLDFADGKWWGVELQATRTVFRRNRVTIGGEYRNNVRQNQTNFSLNPFTLVLDDRRSSFVGAMYAQDELTIAKPLTLNAGLRYDYYSRVESSVNPRMALIYRPFDRTSLKFIYGESFRVPNVYELYYSILPNLPNPTLRPERIRSGEMVWEQGLVGHLWFSTSVFHNSIERLITQEPAGPDLLVFRNLPAVKSTGWELEVKDQLAWGLEGVASYSFQRTTDPATQAQLNNSPGHLVKLSLTQSLFRQKFFASLDAQYRSRMHLPDEGSVSPFAVVNATLLGRRIGKHFDFSASIYNLFNKRYADPSSGVTLQRTIEQDGRSFQVKMTWRLGDR
jgi:iron complex outermembrane receptor protein